MSYLKPPRSSVYSKDNNIVNSPFLKNPLDDSFEGYENVDYISPERPADLRTTNSMSF